MTYTTLVLTLTITLSRQVLTDDLKCEQFPQPKNGQIHCDHIIGKYCTTSCHRGYVPERVAAWAYFCNPVTGRWGTYPEFYPLPWPDCVLKETSRNDVTASQSETNQLIKSSQITPLTKDGYLQEKIEPIPSSFGQLYISRTVMKAAGRSSPVLLPGISKSAVGNFSASSYNSSKNNNQSNTTMLDKESQTLSKLSNRTSVLQNKIGNNNITRIQNNTKNSGVSISDNIHPENSNNTIAPRPLTPTSDHVSYASSVSKNDSSELSYQLVEEHHNNQTQKNELDMTSVKSSNFGNNNYEMDVGNITIATTKNGIPVKSAKSGMYLTKTKNDTLVDGIVVLPNSSNAITKGQMTEAKNHVTEAERIQNEQRNINTYESSHNIPVGDSSASQHVSALQIANPHDSKNVKTLENLQDIKMSTVENSARIKQVENNKDNSEPETKEVIIVPINQNCSTCNVTVQKINPNDKTHINIEITRKKLTAVLKTGQDSSLLGKHDNRQNINKENKNGNQTSITNNMLKTTITSLDSTPAARSFNKNEGKDKEKEDDAKRKRLEQIIRTYFQDVNRVEEENKKKSTEDERTHMPDVPVFSARDLHLLRTMVDAPKFTKRSGLRAGDESSTIWSKMLSLTTTDRLKKHVSKSSPKQLTSRKSLAERDHKLAQVIMQNVNKVGNYAFKEQKNPFIKNILPFYKVGEKRVPHRGDRRQYVWNGATFVPMDDSSSPISYLNSYQGLSENSPYKWNGAVFVPAEDPPTQTSEQQQSPSNIHEPTQQESAIVTAYTPQQQPTTELKNVEIKSILDMWNTGNENSPKSPQESGTNQKNDNAIIFNGQKYVPAPTTNVQDTNSATISYNSYQQSPTKRIDPTTLTVTTNSIFEHNYMNQVLYFWNGESYQAILKNQDLPHDTIKYTYNGDTYDVAPESYYLVSPPPTSTTPTYSTQPPITPVLPLVSSAPVHSDVDKIKSYADFEQTMERMRKGENIHHHENFQSSLDAFHKALMTEGNKDTSQHQQERNEENEALRLNLNYEFPHKPDTSSNKPVPVELKPVTSSLIDTGFSSDASKQSAEEARRQQHLKYKVKSLQSLQNYLSGLKESLTGSLHAHNPYLPPPESPLSLQEKSPEPLTFLKHDVNPYLPKGDNDRIDTSHKTTPTMKLTTKNLFREDEEDLEAVISNDLDIRKEIASLTTLFENRGASDSEDYHDEHPVHQKPSSEDAYKGTLTHHIDVALAKQFEHDYLKETANDDNTNKINKDFSRHENQVDTNNKNEFLATHETKNKDKEDPTKQSPTHLYTNENSLDLRDLREKQEAFMEVLRSLEPDIENQKYDKGELSQRLNNAYEATLSPFQDNSGARRRNNGNEKSSPVSINIDHVPKGTQTNTDMISYNFQNPMDKLLTKPVRVYPERPDAQILNYQNVHHANENINFNANTQEKIHKNDLPIFTDGKPFLNSDQVNDLLKITKLAELSAVKKHGLPYPTTRTTSFRERARTLLKNPRVKRLLHLLIHSKRSKTLLNYLKMSYNEALKRTLLPSKQKLLRLRQSKALKGLFDSWEKKQDVLIPPNIVQKSKAKVVNRNEPIPRFG